MTESELSRRVSELETQNRALAAENKRLRDTLRSYGVEYPHNFTDNEKLLISAKTDAPSLQHVSINKFSTPNEKIELFMSLFRGRTDVYAKRCYTVKYDSSYYIPACENEWAPGICGRPAVKCKNCGNRKLLPLTADVIERHLRNKDKNGAGIAGIYPLLPDDSCLFLAADFDKENWQSDIAIFRTVCENHNVPVAVERSRSGNGGHAWIFFEEPVMAVSARKMGNMLLTESMCLRHEIRFASYDRMFPNQDFMPKGGFGNLIALPLQGGPREKGNSEFVDEVFQSYPDQWAYLASLRKMKATEVDMLISDLHWNSEIGQLEQVTFDNEETQKPWERKKPAEVLEGKDFPSNLRIVDANMLYVTKSGVSQRALNRIKRLAAFQNPKYYQAQRMRMSTHNIPRIICSLDETPKYLGIPRGCRTVLVELLDQAGVKYAFEDKRCAGRPINVSFAGALRDEQQLAADALLAHETGVLSAATAFGKTVIGSALIAKRKCNTLILVHLQTLMNQWKNSLEQFLSIDETLPEIPGGRGRKKSRSVIGQLGSGKNALSGIVDVASIQSLVHGDEVLDVVKDYGMVIVDECHHVPAVNFERVLRAVNARYIYGLTATPFRQDGQHPLIYMQCGRIRYTVDAKAQAAKRSFEHFVVPCFTGFKKPIAQEEANWTITKIYSDIGANVPRNQQITGDIVEAIKNGRTPIILTQRTDHVEALATLLESKTSAHIVKLTGGSSPKSKNESLNALTTITSNELLAVIATGKYAGEGFDYPRLDTLFLAMPIAWKGLLAQYTGRLHREYPGKRDVIVYDYVDVHVAVLERMYHKRLAAYAQIGYMTMAAHNQTERFGAIYDSNSFIPVMKDDFAGAQKEIIIVSPFMRKKRVESIMEWLVSPIQANAGLTVTVVTRPAENFKEKDRTIVGSCVEYLRSAGIHIVFRPNIHQKFVVIDDRLVWYGSVNLLSFGNAEESVMRLESREIAAELSGLVSWGY